MLMAENKNWTWQKLHEGQKTFLNNRCLPRLRNVFSLFKHYYMLQSIRNLKTRKKQKKNMKMPQNVILQLTINYCQHFSVSPSCLFCALRMDFLFCVCVGTHAF